MQALSRLFGRNRRYNDIDVSIREHIQERADELMDEGMSSKQAEQAARREFGNVALIQQRSREQWQWRALESLLADFKFTLRRLRNSPGFAVTVLLTLAIGIGANTAVFSVVDGVLLKPLPYPGPASLLPCGSKRRALRDWQISRPGFAFLPRCISRSPTIISRSSRSACGCQAPQMSPGLRSRKKCTR